MRPTLEKLIKNNGEAQLIVAIEELSELQKETTKYMRGKRDPVSMAEEIADVLIMIEQLRIMMPEVTDDMIDLWTRSKMGRIRDLIGQAEEPDS